MTLYVVSTPIGNLEDITLRALRILKQVDIIACEDTRTTQKLLSHYNIHKKLISYHAYSPGNRIRIIIESLEKGNNVAIVSDSGTPGISDPGYPLITEARGRNIPICSIPGPSALTAACSISGFPVDRFVFLGFLPRKKGRISRLLVQAAQLQQTMVFFESPYRVSKTVKLIGELFGSNSELAIVREITKKFEEVIKGRVGDIVDRLAQHNLKGEIVVLFRLPEERKENQ